MSTCSLAVPSSQPSSPMSLISEASALVSVTLLKPLVWRTCRMNTKEQRCKRQEAPRWLLPVCYSGRERYHWNHFRHIGVFQQVSRGNDDAATAYSHDHTLSLGSFIPPSLQMATPESIPCICYLFLGTHYESSSQGKLVHLKFTKEPIRMNCGTEFQQFAL